MSSTLIKNVMVLDGLGSQPKVQSVLIKADRIASIDPRLDGNADTVISGDGLTLAPGFVDIHTHSDLTRFAYPSSESRIFQGITTEVIGNCGLSPVPMSSDPVSFRQSIGPIDLVPSINLRWVQLSDYLDDLENLDASTNVAALIGHGSIRQFVLANNRRLEGAELAKMREVISEALDAGYWGVSLGLMYAPGERADSAELMAVAQAVKEYEATLSVHMRAYDFDGLPTAVSELINIAEQTGVSLQLSHLRSVADPHGKALDRALELIEQTNANVSADAYPYVAGHTSIVQLFPASIRAFGAKAVIDAITCERELLANELRAGQKFAPEAITIARAGESTAPEVGATLADLAAESEDDWAEVMIDLVERYGASIDVIVVGTREQDADRVLRLPYVSVASDGVALDLDHDANMSHPRSMGTFPRAFRQLVDGGMSLQETVRKMTSMPSTKLGLENRGVLREGAYADLVLFDAQTMLDRATYNAPLTAPQGIDSVWVNGEPVVRSGNPTGLLPGKLLRRTT